jgi:hypothetical protein
VDSVAGGGATRLLTREENAAMAGREGETNSGRETRHSEKAAAERPQRD